MMDVRRAILVGALIVAGCGKNPRYCDQSTECGDPSHVCDLGGVCPESEGLTNSCIPPEAICWDAGGPNTPDASMADASLLDGMAVDADAEDAIPADADTDPPIVVTTGPTAGASGVQPGVSITATFSEDMDPDTIDGSTFLVTLDGEAVAGVVSYQASNDRATFTPSQRLSLLADYEARVTTGATDSGGLGLESDHVWTFTVRDGIWGEDQVIQPAPAGTTGAFRARLAADPAGNAFAVWYQDDGGGNGDADIWANRYAVGSGWGTAGLIETAPGVAAYSRVVVDSTGNATAAWWLSTLGDVWTNRYVVGSGWGTATKTLTDPGDYPHLSIDAGDVVYLIADSSMNRHVPGSGWVGASTAPGFGSVQSLASSAGGTAMLAWLVHDGTQNNVVASRYVAGSGWTSAEPIETAGGNARDLEVAMDPAGHAVAVWAQNDGTRYNIWANRYVAGVGWGTAGLIESSNVADAQKPHVAIDASGNAIATWFQSDGTRTNIWANRFTVGLGWGTATQIEAQSATASLSEIAIDSRGNAIVAFYIYPNIWASRYVAGSGWGTEQIVGEGTVDSVHLIAVALAGDGTGVIARRWRSGGSGPYSIRASTFR